MTARHLNIRDFAYLCAVAEHAHFGRAADACAITQPALSERIRRIEEALDCVVFERTKRSVMLTPTGQRVIDGARKLLDDADQIDALVHSQDKPLTGEFRLGVIATLGPYLIPRLLGSLNKVYPRLQLQLTEGLTEVLLDELVAGSLDAVLAALPLGRGQLVVEPLFFEPFWLAAPKGHSLARKSPVTTRDLRGDEMILLQEGHCLSGQALDVCPSNRRNDVERLQSTGLETLRHMVASGKRYTLLPWLAVGDAPPLKELVTYKPLKGKQTGRTIAIASRTSFARHAFASFVLERLADGLQPV